MGRGAIPGAVSVRKCLLEPPNFSKGEAYPGDLGQGRVIRAEQEGRGEPQEEGSWGDQK